MFLPEIPNSDWPRKGAERTKERFLLPDHGQRNGDKRMNAAAADSPVPHSFVGILHLLANNLLAAEIPTCKQSLSMDPDLWQKHGWQKNGKESELSYLVTNNLFA